MPSDSPPIPLSYLIKQCHERIADPLGVFIRDFASYGLGPPNLDHWNKDRMVVRYPFYGKTVVVEFLNLGWDPDHTASQEGPGSIVSSLPKTYEGAGVLAKLQHSEQGVHYSESQSVTQTRERKTSLTQEVSWDFGAEQTIGGSAFGVSLEAKFSEHFGTKIDTGQEDSEGTSDTVTKQIDYDFPPLRDTLLTLDTASILTRADLTIIGRSESGLRITVPVGGRQEASTWWPHFATPTNHGFIGKPGLAIFEWKTWTDFLTTLEGVNTDWPQVGHYRALSRYDRVGVNGEDDTGPTMPVQPSINQLFDGAMRDIHFVGKTDRTEDGVIEITPQDVTGQDLDELQRRYRLGADQVVDSAPPNG